MNAIPGFGNVATGQFHHVAMSWTGPSMKFYVDGSETASPGVTGIPLGGTSLGIGTGQGGTHWLGLLDDVAIYDRALSQSEVQGIVAAATDGKCN
jgi:hypothetical protein